MHLDILCTERIFMNILTPLKLTILALLSAAYIPTNTPLQAQLPNSTKLTCLTASLATLTVAKAWNLYSKNCKELNKTPKLKEFLQSWYSKDQKTKKLLLQKDKFLVTLLSATALSGAATIASLLGSKSSEKINTNDTPADQSKAVPPHALPATAYNKQQSKDPVTTTDQKKKPRSKKPKSNLSVVQPVTTPEKTTTEEITSDDESDQALGSDSDENLYPTNTNTEQKSISEEKLPLQKELTDAAALEQARSEKLATIKEKLAQLKKEQAQAKAKKEFHAALAQKLEAAKKRNLQNLVTTLAGSDMKANIEELIKNEATVRRLDKDEYHALLQAMFTQERQTAAGINDLIKLCVTLNQVRKGIENPNPMAEYTFENIDQLITDLTPDLKDPFAAGHAFNNLKLFFECKQNELGELPRDKFDDLVLKMMTAAQKSTNNLLMVDMVTLAHNTRRKTAVGQRETMENDAYTAVTTTKNQEKLELSSLLCNFKEDTRKIKTKENLEATRKALEAEKIAFKEKEEEMFGSKKPEPLQNQLPGAQDLHG